MERREDAQSFKCSARGSAWEGRNKPACTIDMLKEQ